MVVLIILSVNDIAKIGKVCQMSKFFMYVIAFFIRLFVKNIFFPES